MVNTYKIREKQFYSCVLICGLRCLPPPNIISLGVGKGSHLSFVYAEELLLCTTT